MGKVTFVTPEGEECVVDGQNDHSLMEIATRTGVSGIYGDCGGACACATCHVYVGLEWQDKLPSPDATEEAMLEFADNVTPQSRLSCQLRMKPELDGITVVIPRS